MSSRAGACRRDHAILTWPVSRPRGDKSDGQGGAHGAAHVAPPRLPDDIANGDDRAGAIVARRR